MLGFSKVPVFLCHPVLVIGIEMFLGPVFHSVYILFLFVCTFTVGFVVISSDSVIASKLLSQCVNEKETELEI